MSDQKGGEYHELKHNIKIEEESEGEYVNSVETESRSIRKRKCKLKRKNSKTQNEKTKYYHFKIINFKISDTIKQKLFIFNSDQQKYCHDYVLNSSNKNKYECCSCRRNQKNKAKISIAKIMKNKSGKDFIKITPHLCQQKLYKPENERKIIFKPDYKIFCRVINGIERKRIFIFDPTNKELGYEYSVSKNGNFDCMKCTIKGRKSTRAKLFYENTPDEYLELHSEDHVCELLSYNVTTCKYIVLKPNFTTYTITKDGKELKRLFIFDSTDKSSGYEYRYETKAYRCVKCGKNHCVTAKICQDRDGNDYLQLGSNDHICKPQIFDDIQKKNIKKINEQKVDIIDSSMFKVFPSLKKEGTKRVIMLKESDKSMCYELTFLKNISNASVYCCYQCRRKKHQFTVKLCQQDDGEYFIQQGKDKKHACKAVKFNPKKYEAKNLKYVKERIPSNKITDFQEAAGKFGGKKLIIPALNEPNLYYEFRRRKANQLYLCNECEKMGGYTSARIVFEKNGNEKYVVMGRNNHICKPKERDPSKNDNIKKEATRFTNFQLLEGRNWAKHPKLIVFTSEDQTLCYEYTFNQENIFVCDGCKPSKRLTAKIVTDQTTKYLQFNSEEHVCVAKIFNSNDFVKQKCVLKPEFEIFHNTKREANSRIVIFDSNNHNFGYAYRKSSGLDCGSCKSLGKRVGAKICNDENGEQYVKLSNTEHICKQLDFLQMGRIVHSSNFEIRIASNSNKKITTMHPKDKNLCYKFAYDNNLQTFYCIECQKRDYFNAGKICENKEYFLLAFDHICHPLNI